MLNEVNEKNTIGIKKLSDADLGVSTGNTSHIGLFEDTLIFIKAFDETVVTPSQLIHNNKVVETLTVIDYIKKPDGSFRSPKMRSGYDHELIVSNQKSLSTVRYIRKVAKKTKSDWFLLWFGLDTNELVFYLFSGESIDFVDIQNIIGKFGERKKVQSSSSEFKTLINYLGKKVENLNLEYYEELEISTQVGSIEGSKRVIPRVRDIEKANKLFKETGQRGEELLNEYLKFQKSNSFIKDYKWMNENSETALPYDFEITRNDNAVIYSDAKATKYKFDQPIVLSSGELKFINQHKDQYLIHRLYSVFDDPKLRVCKNIHIVSDVFIPNYNSFNSTLKNNGLGLRNTSLSVPANLAELSFESEILLTHN